MMLSRRRLLQAAALAPWLAPAALRAQSGARTYTTSIALEDNRVWIAATLGGSRPLQFVVDTGGEVSLIQERLAQELRLRPLRDIRLVGGGGPRSFRFYEARDIRFSSGLRQPSAVFGASPGELALGPDAAGTMAAGLFTAQDSDLDFARGEWRLYPDGRGDWNGLEAVPSQIRHPNNATGSAFIIVDVAIDGQTYKLIADTGMPGQISLDAAASGRSGLWNDAGPWAPFRGAGIGGPRPLGRLVRAGRAAIGSNVFERPLVELTDHAESGPISGYDGIIGLQLLERLNLATDVRAGRLWVQPNGRPAPPERFGLTGLWADERGGRVVIVDVSPRSPAAEAGVRVGDQVETPDLRSFVRTLGGPPGRPIFLRLRRNGQSIETTLTPRVFI